MKEALAEHQRWASQRFGSVLSRFSCPVDRLVELLAAPLQGETLQVGVIGRSAKDRDEWSQLREGDARLMTEFENRIGNRAEIAAYEVRVPSDRAAEEYFDELVGFSSVDVFAELPWEADTADAIAAASGHDWLALKARTGGTKSGSVPSAEDLAELIWCGMSLEVPFKLTAGLHHALPNVNPDTGDRQHGFLNVLTASVLAYVEEMPSKELVGVLRCDDPGKWFFSEHEMTFWGHSVSTSDIDAPREIFLGFGSCSIKEPYDDIRSLGWS